MKTLQTLALIVCFSSCSLTNREWQAQHSSSDALHRSVKKITDVIVHDIFSPPTASRIYVYASVAAYEAARHDDTTFLTLANQLKDLKPFPEPEADKEYSFQLAAVQAALSVGRKLTFSEEKIEEFHRAILQEFRETGMPEEIFQRSKSFGDAIANHVITWSETDNYKQSRSFPKYSITDEDYAWKPTPPAYMDAIEPHWNKIRTLVLESAEQFMPERPTPFSIDEDSQFYKEVMETYQYGRAPSEEERAIAAFWDCNPFMLNVKGHVMFATKKISPNGHWMNITRVACEKSNFTNIQSAEAYARIAISMFDGIIACWDEKYRSRLIRPETYINKYIDEEWVPMLQTPPFPEYLSGHSVISSSAQVILTSLFGDNFAFVDSTEVEFGMDARSFTSFEHAAEEASISRLYGGIHYRPAIEHGIKQGLNVGHLVDAKVITRARDKKQPVAESVSSANGRIIK